MAEVLFLTQLLPYPLDAGAKVRQYHMLRHLAKRHAVTLACFTRADDTPGAAAHVKSFCSAVHAVPMRRSLGRNLGAAAEGLASGQPIAIVRDRVGEMVSTLRWLTQGKRFDVVHADQLSMSWYGQLAARMAGSQRPATLLDEHNAIYLLARRMADTERNPLRRMVMAREARAFVRYESGMCRAYDALLTVTQEDRDHLLALFSPEQRPVVADKLTVVPIAVDPDSVAPVVHQAGDEPTILHLGTMFWPPNVTGVLWFAREVLPLIRQQRPEVRFVVAGKNPPPEVQALAADPRVLVTGYVRELAPYLETADVFVVPLLAGGGMRVKILDAWLWGLPIVSTPIGAEGIEVQDGENILLAGDAQAFAQATLQLLADQTLNQRLRTNGRAWVEARFAWRAVYERVDAVYARLLDRGVGEA